MRKRRKPFVCNEMGGRFFWANLCLGLRLGNVPYLLPSSFKGEAKDLIGWRSAVRTTSCPCYLRVSVLVTRRSRGAHLKHVGWRLDPHPEGPRRWNLRL